MRHRRVLRLAKHRERGSRARGDALLGSALGAMLAHRRLSPRALCDCYAPGRHVEVFHSLGSVPRRRAEHCLAPVRSHGFGFPQASVRLRSYERR